MMMEKVTSTSKSETELQARTHTPQGEPATYITGVRDILLTLYSFVFAKVTFKWTAPAALRGALLKAGSLLLFYQDLSSMASLKKALTLVN